MITCCQLLSVHTSTHLNDFVLEFNDTSTLVGHFVSSPREREKRDSRGDERKGWGKKEEQEWKWRTEETRNVSVWHRCPRPGPSSPTHRHFAKNEVEKRAITLIIGRFYPKSNLTIFYDYIPVYKIWIQYTNQSFLKKYRKENIFWRWKRAITPIIKGWFYPNWNLTSVLWWYTCVLNMNSIHCFQKISNWNYFSTLKKGHNSKNNWWILPLTKLDIYFIIICLYMYIKYESNSLIFSNYGMESIFQSWKRAIPPKIIGGFYPKLNLTYILWLHTCVLNLNPIHWSFQKISNGNLFSRLIKGRNSKNNWWILP